MPGLRSLTGRLIVAALAVAAAVLLRAALGLLPGQAPPLLALLPAVVVAALVGGRLVGLAATATAALAEGLLFSPAPDATAFVLFLAGGALTSFLVGTQLRARRDADERADRASVSVARLETILAGAPVGFAFLDRRQYVINANPALSALCARPEAQLVGQPIEAVLPAGPSPRDLVEQVFTTGQPVLAHEWTARLPLGEERTWLVSFYPIPSAHQAGQVEMVGAVALDVSPFAQAMKDLRRRAGELTETERRKDIFLAMLSHELRNPLAALRNAIDLLVLGEPARAEVLTLFRRQMGLLTRLVDDLLDTARVSRGQIELRRHTVQLPGVIEAAIETARPALDERRHFVETTLPPRSVMVRGDVVRLTQAVSNLLHNAARYTPPGGTVSVRLDVEGNDAVIRVTDTGVGIAPEMLGRIFELFHQGEPPPGEQREGLGLGLTLVRRLVELHGGSVGATSPGPGLGSTFEIRLPALPMTTTPSPHPADQLVRPSARRVLVVDDNADAAESLSLLLQVQGHEVKVVHDGLAAVDVVASWEPHVVFLDLGLPGMDGFEVLKELRQRHGGDSPRVIALTGFGQQEDRKKGLEAGFDEFLVKPAGPEELGRAMG
jgi:signal transduction histidine kinase